MLESNKHDPFCEFLISRLIAATWLESYTYSDGSGYELQWTREGDQRIFLLRELIEHHDVSPDSAKSFTRACESRDPAVPESTATFWLECIRELELAKEAATLGKFVQAIRNSQAATNDAS